MDWATYNDFRKQFSNYNSFREIPLMLKTSFEFASEIAKGKKVLDIGASRRHFESFCKQKNISLKEYKTQDIDLTTKPDYKNIDEIKEKFDLITIFATIEHLNPEQSINLLQKCSKLTNQIIITTNNIYFPVWGFFDDVTHVKPYSPRTLYALLKKANFNNIKIYRIYKKGLIPIFIKKIQSKITNHDFSPEILVIASK
jgi:hypothetical protein